VPVIAHHKKQGENNRAEEEQDGVEKIALLALGEFYGRHLLGHFG
jgi:hypothetical protein